MAHLRVFKNHEDYEFFIVSGTMYYPNVSVCEEQYEAHYNDNGTIDKNDGRQKYGIIEIDDVEPFECEGGIETGISLTTAETNRWKLKDKSDWLNVSPISGVGSIDLTVEADEYENEEEDREGFFNIGYTMPDSTYSVSKYGIVQKKKIDYNKTPLTFEVLSGGTIKWACFSSDDNSGFSKTIEYKKNDGEWTSITSVLEEFVMTSFTATLNDNSGGGGRRTKSISGDVYTFYYDSYNEETGYLFTCDNINVHFWGRLQGGTWVYDDNDNSYTVRSIQEQQTSFAPTINVDSGDIVQFRGNNTTYCDETYWNPNFSGFRSSSCAFNIYGNIMSLINASAFTELTTLTGNYSFSNLFNGSQVVSTKKLILPATILTQGCYSGMFAGCYLLVDSPDLPATTLADSCYNNMFESCDSLTTAPELPATILADACYQFMFRRCYSLVTPPSSIGTSATTLAGLSNCCYFMFEACQNLTTAPELPALVLGYQSYNGMFEGCTALEEAPDLPATTLGDCCYQYMFNGCSSINSLPELPASALTTHCYASMFYGTSITTIPYDYLPITTLTNSCYASMFAGCTELTNVPDLPATTLADYCYDYMFAGCTSLTDVPCDLLPATDFNGKYCCYRGMFKGCTSLEEAPDLLATNIGLYTYEEMFQNCSSLNYIRCLASGTTAITYNTKNWVSGVASAGTFVKAIGMNGWLTDSVNGIPSGWTAKEDYEGEPLTFVILSDGDIVWRRTSSWTTEKNIEYSKDNGQTWTTITSTTGGMTIPVLSGETVQFRGDNISYGNKNPIISDAELIADVPSSPAICCMGGELINVFTSKSTFSGTTCQFKVKGNIMSLISSICFCRLKSFSSTYIFDGLFAHCTGLTDTGDLLLPVTNLSDASYCYYEMFSGCTSLTTAPALPATTLASSCYSNMFSGCTSLTTAPALPATTLASTCYYFMFGGCTSLTNAPELLPATNLSSAFGCYEYMFYECTSLTTAPELPATTLASSCYYGMFQGCTSLTTAPELPATTLSQSCYYGMFSGCTSLTTAPELPATILQETCYFSMFYGCTSLITAPELPATTLANHCYQSMFAGCTSLTTPPLTIGTSAATLGIYCCDGMFSGCTSLTTAPALPTTTLASACYKSMFYGCTNLTTAPELPATILADACYQFMFYGCTNLNYIKCLATDISASNCTGSWVTSVASSGTFVKHPNMSSWTTGVIPDGIPNGWTVEDAIL